MKERVFVFIAGMIIGICLVGYLIIRNIVYADHLSLENVITHQSTILR